jgi:HSP20 family protein
MKEQELKVRQKQEVQRQGETTKQEKYFVPAVDIFETETEVTVVAEMPGVGPEGVEVTLEDDLLIISGRMQDDDPPEARLLLQEYDQGHYQRRFTVAETIDQENINATVSMGLLKIVLPKIKPPKPRKIEVKVG